MSTSSPAPASNPADHPLAHTYDADFYGQLADDVRASAAAVVPIVTNLLSPTSVLDVGCGHGTWLAEFEGNGATDILGVDGGHVDPAALDIRADQFQSRDLRVPFDLGRRFDLVVSLEVAEHLPASAAAGFVGTLVAHGAAVLFSAAVPFQGGAGHVNERWPSYWAGLFAQHGYEPVDVVRTAVWDNEQVAFWYAQNTILYLHGSRTGITAGVSALPLDVVHPRMHVRDHTRAKAARATVTHAHAARRTARGLARAAQPHRPRLAHSDELTPLSCGR